MNKTKRIMKGMAVAITILTILFTGAFVLMIRGLDENSQPELAGMGASGLSDGVYHGGYDGGRFTNRVEVAVANGEIQNIRIAQDMLFSMADVSETLFRRVQEQQSTAVDVVSGATVTSTAYLKAIENALTGKGE